MTPTPCIEWLDALYLLGLRIYALVHLLTYLLTYTFGSGRIKPAISLKQLKIERKLLNASKTAYIVGHGHCRRPIPGFGNFTGDEKYPPQSVQISDYLGRPSQPFQTGLCFTRDVIFFSPLVLRGPSTDRPETLPHGRNLV